jgi:hypothetical protein
MEVNSQLQASVDFLLWLELSLVNVEELPPPPPWLEWNPVHYCSIVPVPDDDGWWWVSSSRWNAWQRKPQITHDLIQARTHATGVGSSRLTASATARPIRGGWMSPKSVWEVWRREYFLHLPRNELIHLVHLAHKLVFILFKEILDFCSINTAVIKLLYL